MVVDTNPDSWNFCGCLTNSGMPSAGVPTRLYLNDTIASPKPDVFTLTVRFSTCTSASMLPNIGLIQIWA